MRGHVALSGSFGYELDLNRLSDEERETVRRQVATCKELRGLLQNGVFHRLRSPFEGNTAAWMVTSDDGSPQAVVFHFQVLSRPNPPCTLLRLRALDPYARYHVAELDQTFGGDVLMHAGLQFPDATHDFTSHMWRLTKV